MSHGLLHGRKAKQQLAKGLELLAQNPRIPMDEREMYFSVLQSVNADARVWIARWRLRCGLPATPETAKDSI